MVRPQKQETGYFTDEVQAARAYNAAILPQAGEFARLNNQR